MIKEKLKPERQKLFIALGEYIKQLHSQSTQEIITIPICQEASETIKELMKMRLMEKRIEDVQEISTKLLDDLSNYENFAYLIKETATDLKHQNTELFESWCNSVIISIKNEALRYSSFVSISLKFHT